MKLFLSWLGTAMVGISLILAFMLQPSIANMVLMLLGVVGLALSVFTTMDERQQLERRLKQERQQRIDSLAAIPGSRESLMQNLYPDPKMRPKS